MFGSQTQKIMLRLIKKQKHDVTLQYAVSNLFLNRFKDKVTPKAAMHLIHLIIIKNFWLFWWI